MEILKDFIAALLCRCPKCSEPLDCIRDWSGGDKSDTTYLHDMFIDNSSIDAHMRSEDLYC